MAGLAGRAGHADDPRSGSAVGACTRSRGRDVGVPRPASLIRGSDPGRGGHAGDPRSAPLRRASAPGRAGHAGATGSASDIRGCDVGRGGHVGAFTGSASSPMPSGDISATAASILASQGQGTLTPSARPAQSRHSRSNRDRSKPARRVALECPECTEAHASCPRAGGPPWPDLQSTHAMTPSRSSKGQWLFPKGPRDDKAVARST